MRANTSILVIGADGDDAAKVQARLTDRGHRTSRVATGKEGLAYLQRVGADLVVIAPPLLEGPPGVLLSRLRDVDHDLPIVVAGSSEHVRPEELMYEGAFECVVDPLERPEMLLRAVGYALGAREEDRELRYLRGREVASSELGALVGEDAAMVRVFELVRRVCNRTARGATPTILVTGETGTGKGALAKAIHGQSVRRNRPFVEINCAALPANLVESELFGYERGAFTDANRARAGLFETADGGTLFLDEVPSLPLDLQAKLLTVIEDKTFRRLGGRQSMRVDVQLIAASQPVLKRMVQGGKFREDLFHRLNVLAIGLPPLRDRGADRVLLATRFVEQLSRQYGIDPKPLSKSAHAFIERYHWPGNVRELRNQIERIVLLSETDDIQGWQFERASGEFLRIDPEEDVAGAGFRLQLPPGGFALNDLEREVIRAALEKHGGNVSETARYLSITRQTLIYRVKKHGLG